MVRMQKAAIKVMDVVLLSVKGQLRVAIEVTSRQMIKVQDYELMTVVWLLVRMPIQDLIKIVLPLTIQSHSVLARVQAIALWGMMENLLALVRMRMITIRCWSKHLVEPNLH